MERMNEVPFDVPEVRMEHRVPARVALCQAGVQDVPAQLHYQRLAHPFRAVARHRVTDFMSEDRRQAAGDQGAAEKGGSPSRQRQASDHSGRGHGSGRTAAAPEALPDPLANGTAATLKPMPSPPNTISLETKQSLKTICA